MGTLCLLAAGIRADMETQDVTTQRRTYQNRILLEEFWSKAHARSPKTRLLILQDFARRELLPDPYRLHDPEWMRKKYRQRRARGFVRTIGECWVCRGDAVDRHHVIPIKNGGRNTVKNIVPLCKPCHVAVHGEDPYL
jgi:5-methylcytosine-specific restriction endonuclease McrA